VTVAGLLLVATVALPLAMVMACLSQRFRDRVLGWLPLAPVPGLMAAVLAPGGSIVIAPPPLRLTLALDAPGAMLLGGAALLWCAAGFYASIYLRTEAGRSRFGIWWLLTMTGSVGLFIVADLTSFYLAFSLASLSAYGLVAFETTPRARRASQVYMALALLGEAVLLLGLVMLATAVPAIGNPLIREAVAALPDTPLQNPALLLLILGFALKMGLVPLHVWMPLAHPVAPMPASAVLSGIIVKAGVIGLIRFLPLDVAMPGWGGVLVVAGLFTAFYAVLVGITQEHPKTVLAYSTVSQMGVVAAVLGAGLASAAPGTAMLAAFYALHHLLVKGALFLGVGIVATTGPRRLRWVLLAMALLALSLAGLPFTSGALAKFAAKPLLGGGPEATMMKLSAAGSALLMLHFLAVLRRTAAPGDRAATPQVGLLTLAWASVALASLVIPWALFSPVTGYAVPALVARAALWDACWPIALGAVLAAMIQRMRSVLPRIPEGDAVVLMDRIYPAVARIGDGIDKADRQLRRWPAASLILVLLVIGLTAVLQFGG
jgi:formate hydrogenlyase subunit 3/multisubunit Na+/H+ antiporter MnhD subunit